MQARICCTSAIVKMIIEFNVEQTPIVPRFMHLSILEGINEAGEEEDRMTVGTREMILTMTIMIVS
jgi:hypothetical protein